MGPLFLKTNKSVDDVAVVGGYRRADGKVFFLLHRVKNTYSKNPLFLAEYSNDYVAKRNDDGTQENARKMYVYQLSQEALAVLKNSEVKKNSLGLFGNKELKTIFGGEFERLAQAQYQPAFAGPQIYILSPR